MALCDPIDGLSILLRCVEVTDAERLLSLRTDKRLTRFLPPLQGTLEDQQNWIKRQRAAPGDYYFAIERKELKAEAPTEGFIGLYCLSEADRAEAEWGRWILSKSSLASVESAFLIYQFAFDVLGLKRVFCRSIAENISVLSFHDRCGLKRTGLLRDEFIIGEKKFDAVVHSLTYREWPAIKAEIYVWVERFAPLLSR